MPFMAIWLWWAKFIELRHITSLKLRTNKPQGYVINSSPACAGLFNEPPTKRRVFSGSMFVVG